MNSENTDQGDELVRLRLENEALRANRKQFDARALELEGTIERLTKTGPLRDELAERLIPLTADEIEIVQWVLDKLNGEGREEHKDLDHATADRSIAEWAANQLDEFVDTAFYSLGKRARARRGLA